MLKQYLKIMQGKKKPKPEAVLLEFFLENFHSKNQTDINKFKIKYHWAVIYYKINTSWDVC